MAVLIWGTNFAVIMWGLAELPPFLFSTLRFLLTAFPWILFVKRPAIPWHVFVGVGMLMGAGQFGLLYFAMHRFITPGLASLLMQTQVIFTILLALIINKNRITTLQVVALALAAAGIGWIAWRSATSAGASVTLFGVLLVLAAAFCWALANLLVQSVGRVDVIAFLVWSGVFAVPPLLLFNLLLEGASRDWAALSTASATAWCVVLWQVFGNTLFGFGVWNWLLARHAATVVAPISLLVPVFGMSASAWLLAEPLPLWKVAAASLVLLGLALNAYASRSQSTAP